MELKALFFRTTSFRATSSKAVSVKPLSFKNLSFKTIVHRTLLTFALLTAAVPAWSAKEAPATEAPKTVNINTADAATLADVLTGVGLAKAEAIIAYRKEHGGFKSVEQLSEVKGIGEKLVKANQERIVVK